MTVRADDIDALLPQTQCRQCGYAGCRPYAEALAGGTAPINRCPPGGAELIDELAHLLGLPALALDASCGITQPPAVALIDEAWCIGCTLCIQACPVDAIVGAAKAMHTVIAAECTGCELCIAPCPVDCIQMIAVEPTHDRAARLARADQWRNRYRARQQRLSSNAGHSKAKPRVGTAREITPHKTTPPAQDAKQAAVARALARAQARLAQKQKI